MSKVYFVIAIVVFVVALYLLNRPSPSSPIVKVPDVITQPTTPPTSPPIDYSDLVTEDVVVGTGEEATAGKKVAVQYRGTLSDGTEFDSSYKRDNTPLEFVVGAGQMIPGFDKGVQGMKVGGTRKITIPPELGYGSTTSGPIPANSTLMFEVVLESVE